MARQVVRVHGILQGGARGGVRMMLQCAPCAVRMKSVALDTGVKDVKLSWRFCERNGFQMSLNRVTGEFTLSHTH